MYTFEIGKQFPVPGYQNMREGAISILTEDFFLVLVSLEHPSQAEINDFEKGKMNVCFYENKKIPFVVIEYKSFNFEACINILKINESCIEPWLNSTVNMLNIFLTDASTGILVAMRMVGLNPAICDKIRDTCELQTEEYSDSEDIEKSIAEIMRSVSTSEMIKSADLKQSFK